MSRAKNQTFTAEHLYEQMKRMPDAERSKFFLLLANKAFRNNDLTDNFTHKEVFGDTHATAFSAAEAAEYLEISMPTLRRYVQSGKLAPTHTIGRNQMFSAEALRTFKQVRKLASVDR
jgi:excisionase family DNA binding protein